MHQYELQIDGYCLGPMFAPISKIRPPVRIKGKEGAVHRAQTKRATPHWLNDAQKAEIKALYGVAKYKTATTGELWVVDHIVPKISKLVCGLHVPWNLRVIHWKENTQKGAFVWPCMPMEQSDLFYL